MPSLVEQIRGAQIEKGWSVQQLLDKSGLSIDRTVLQRKLSGKVPVTTAECEAMARALQIVLVWPKRRRRTAA